MARDVSDALTRYNADVDRAMRRVVDSLPDSPLASMVRYHLGWVDASGAANQAPAGKGLRPALCLLSCEEAGGRVSDAFGVAAAIELIHNFSLVHDDVQDQSPERRHRPAVWKLWGEGQAINVGDAIFALAHLAVLDEQISHLESAVQVIAIRRLNQCCLNLVTGQTLDLLHQRRLDLSTDDYFRMIGGKTSDLIATSCELGAVVAGADSDRVAAFRRFGRLAGLAFQIVDDVLGIWGDDTITGKPRADDVFKQKVTLPVLEGFVHLNDADRTTLKAIYAGLVVSSDDVARALELLDRAGARERVEETARAYLADSLAALDEASPSGDGLRALAHRLVERET
jgi:geranylgeranyl diphosphate synthase, type I